jgi:hypothetical protein
VATSLAAAREKFVRKMNSTGGANYDAAKGRMVENYRNGFQHLGVTVGPNTTRAYQEGVSSVSGSDVAQRAASAADKWERNYRARMAQ